MKNLGKLLLITFTSIISLISYGEPINSNTDNGSVTVDNGSISLQGFTSSSGPVNLYFQLNKKRCLAASITGEKGQLFTCVLKDKSAKKVSLLASNGNAGELEIIVYKDKSYIKVISSLSAVNIKIKSQILSLPDLLSEDSFFFATDQPSSYTIPGDNHFLSHFLDDGKAILTCVWHDKNCSISTGKTDPNGALFDSLVLRNSKTPFSFHLNLLAAEGVWCKVSEKINLMKHVKVKWRAPFPAKWNISMRRQLGAAPEADGLDQSWFIPNKDIKERVHGVAITNTETFQAWSSSMGGYLYPVFFSAGEVNLKYPLLPDHRRKRYKCDESREPIIYPIKNKNRATPENRYCHVSVAEKLLEMETLKTLKSRRHKMKKYPATCGVTKRIEKIFYNDEQKEKEKEIINKLNQMDKFVINIRKRIDEYRQWASDTKKWLEIQKKANPKLTETVDRYSRILDRIEFVYNKKLKLMKTPPECAALSQEIIDIIDSGKDEEAQEEACKLLGRQIRKIGGNQDSTVGTFRVVLEALRQQATKESISANDPVKREFLNKLRSKTGEFLIFKYMFEG